jgi:hypothetical protein
MKNLHPNPALAVCLLLALSCSKTVFTNLPAAGSLPTQGLIAFYPFNGNANDASGYGHHASLNGGVTWVNDRFGAPQHACHFNGTDAFLTIVDSSEMLNFNINTQSYSISSWVRFDSLANTRDMQVLIDRGTSKNEPSSYNIFYRGSLGRFVANAWDGVESIILPSVTKPMVNVWYHLVMVADSKTVRLYVNGTRELSDDGASYPDSIPQGFMSTSNHEMRRTIGDVAPCWVDGHHYFIGAIDDMRIYGRALTDADIYSLYHEGGL